NHNMQRFKQDMFLNQHSNKNNNFDNFDDFDNFDNNTDNNTDNNMNIDNFVSGNFVSGKKKSKRIGEITGKNLKIDNTDVGMPYRGDYNTRKTNNKHEALTRLDFNLYDSDSEDEDINDIHCYCVEGNKCLQHMKEQRRSNKIIHNYDNSLYGNYE